MICRNARKFIVAYDSLASFNSHYHFISTSFHIVFHRIGPMGPRLLCSHCYTGVYTSWPRSCYRSYMLCLGQQGSCSLLTVTFIPCIVSYHIVSYHLILILSHLYVYYIYYISLHYVRHITLHISYQIISPNHRLQYSLSAARIPFKKNQW